MSDLINFALLQLRPGVTPLTAPNVLTTANTGGTTAVANRAFAAIVGDGDALLEATETGYVLAAAASGSGVASTTVLNAPDDPVRITAHARNAAGVVGPVPVDGSAGANNTWGFGVRSGSEGNARYLTRGESITWTLNDKPGAPQRLEKVTFTVDRDGNTAATEIALDFDGDVARNGTYAPNQTAANADAALRLSVPGGAVVAIDFILKTVTVTAGTGPAAVHTVAEPAFATFFAHYEASLHNTVTIGGIGTAGFSVRGLTLQRGDFAGPAVNNPPTVSLDNLTTTLAENAPVTTHTKVADIHVSDDDGIGVNQLSLTGTDAALFEIVGNELFLKAGVVLSATTNPALDVNVVVDDLTIGNTSEASAAHSITVTPTSVPMNAITFGLVQLKPGVTPLTAPNGGVLSLADTGGTTGVANRALVAVVGDGDQVFEGGGETGYVLSGMGSANHVANSATLNPLPPATPNDPVTITAHGRSGTNAVGGLTNRDAAVAYGSPWGFGVDNGPDANGRYLNSGDSITWTLNAKGGVAQKLTKFTFVVDMNGAATATQVAFAFDGNVVKNGTYAASQNVANADAALLLSVHGGDKIEIDFITRQVTVITTFPGGGVQPGTDAFFTAHDATPNTLTVGRISNGNGTAGGFSVRDLVLDRGDFTGPVNTPPTVALANMITSLPENADLSTRFKVADIVVTDDAVGTNGLSLTGADAGLFEIFNGALYLRAGTLLDFEANPRLDVIVSVDDPTVGATPDASASLGIDLSDFDEFNVGAISDTNAAANVVAEGAATGAAVGITAFASDADATTNAITYSLVDDSGGRFAIDGTTGQVTVANGSLINFATAASHGIVVQATSADGSTSTQAMTIQVSSVNQAPTAVTLSNVVATLPESTDTSARIKVADIAVTDDALGTNVLALTGADASLFEIDGNVLYLKAGTVLNFESKSSYDVAVTVDDPTVGATPDATSAPLGLTLTDVNEAPTAVTLTNIATLLENADVSVPVKVADIVVTDDALGTNVLALSGADAALFEITGNALYLRAGTNINFENRTALDVTVAVDDATVGGTPDATAALHVNIVDVVERYGSVALDGALGDWGPDTRLDTRNGTAGYALYGGYQANAFVFAIETTSVPIGANTTLWLDTDLDPLTGFQVFGNTVGAEYSIEFGADGKAALYSVAPGQAPVLLTNVLDYTFNAGRTVMECALPSNLMAGAPTKANLFVDVNEAAYLPNPYSAPGYLVGRNDAPTVALTNIQTVLENANVSARVKVADIVVSDDGLGTNTLLLSGADATHFEIIGSELFLKANTALDFETKPTFAVQVDVDDATIPGSPDASTAFTLAIGDVNETVGTITLDGSLAEWGAGTRLDTPANGVTGYAVHGVYQADAFVLGIKTDGTAIGPNTTIWFDTDLNKTTGNQVFGWAAGAEYNINFGADGTAALYTGADGQTLVAANLDYVLNADRSVIEIALPSSLVGGSRRADVYIDVNNSPFLPNDYTNGYRVEEKAPLLPQDPTMRVAIVYSETSANHYFDKTAYGQLFMAAQNQAMQAGTPFDILSEADLTNIANLVGYDAIVFPGLSHVQSSQLQAITATLTTAVNDYKIGLIVMGNFLTNDQTGAAIPGDSYARMKSLLGVTLDGFGSTAGVMLQAESGAHPVTDRYAPNEVVGSYNNNSYVTFRDVSGAGETLFTQVVGGNEVPAIIATTTGGRNVHFATDAVFGNNNILSEAINWSARGAAPDVGLEMTRGSSIFFSRTDMDQSQEIHDVEELNPGIYDAMNAIVAEWYADYGFVGSYYFNIGADSPDQRTNWATSKPYYDQLLAMENEIGTHSYTHPHDTNTLLPDVFTEAQRQAWLAAAEVSTSLRNQLAALSLAETQQKMTSLLAQADPRNASPVDPASLNAVDREILKASYRFQFEYSTLIIEREIGIDLIGAAVPGQPEKLAATLAMLQHLEYLTGGYTGVGAGYPGAFGFLNPDNTDKVYFAPNVTFDFSLIGFRGLTAAEAEAFWAQEYAAITAKGTTPIIHFPWHDYGATNWPSEPGQNPGYTLQMFTNFIARAYADGTEFVTGADLAQRIESFVATNVEIHQVGNEIVANVTGIDVGKFALDVDTNQVIASVEDWYAFDGKKVFLPKNGGTFEITLGGQEADVTRIAALPMRAELLSATGDGSDLSFTVNGKGDVVVDVKGGGAVVASGADQTSLNGELMTLTFSTLGTHVANIDYQGGSAAALTMAAAAAGTESSQGGPQVTGTDGDDFVFGSEQGMRIFGGLGTDVLFGGGGDDVFMFRNGSETDTVLDFTQADDRIELVNSGFAGAASALAAFVDTAAGVTLTLSGTDHLVIADVTLAQLTEGHLILTDELLA